MQAYLQLTASPQGWHWAPPQAWQAAPTLPHGWQAAPTQPPTDPTSTTQPPTVPTSTTQPPTDPRSPSAQPPTDPTSTTQPISHDNMSRPPLKRQRRNHTRAQSEADAALLTPVTRSRAMSMLGAQDQPQGQHHQPRGHQPRGHQPRGEQPTHNQPEGEQPTHNQRPAQEPPHYQRQELALVQRALVALRIVEEFSKEGASRVKKDMISALQGENVDISTMEDLEASTRASKALIAKAAENATMARRVHQQKNDKVKALRSQLGVAEEEKRGAEQDVRVCEEMQEALKNAFDARLAGVQE